MLVKKPKRVDYRKSQDAGELFPIHEHDYAFLLDERDYYKARAEFAIAALEKSSKVLPDSSFCLRVIKQALTALKDNE